MQIEKTNPNDMTAYGGPNGQLLTSTSNAANMPPPPPGSNGLRTYPNQLTMSQLSNSVNGVNANNNNNTNKNALILSHLEYLQKLILANAASAISGGNPALGLPPMGIFKFFFLFIITLEH